jgi:tetratricopeptide (TPR) repeat protein
MNRQQIILIFSAIAVTAGLYFGGPTIGAKKPPAKSVTDNGPHNAEDFVIETFLTENQRGLSPSRQQYLLALENEVKRGNVSDQQLHVFHQQASFWKDSVANPVAYFYYLSRAATLDKSEKNLTFAAHSILGYLPFAEQPAQRVWLANEGRSLFEQALQVNPKNDSSKIGLGACYMYGASKGGDNNPMAGIMKVREVAQKDSNNLFAQYMLGVGGVISGQYDKAVQRFERVAKAQPNNLEVLFKLAETYETMGDKPNAIRWYENIERGIKIPEMKAELQHRITELRNAN